MNISEFRTSEEDVGCSIERLEELCNNAGNCVMNGFLRDSVDACKFDFNGVLEFSSNRERDGLSISSKGAVLPNGILIKQTQKSDEANYYNLYSWNKDGDSYTYLSFDNVDVLNRYYDVIKRFGYNLCDEDITDLFKEMGLSFDNVTQVLLNQKVDPIQIMFDEEANTSFSKEDSFVL